jgi:hypothetical protein
MPGSRVASLAVAIVMALALFDASPSDAYYGRASRSLFRASTMRRSMSRHAAHPHHVVRTLRRFHAARPTSPGGHPTRHATSGGQATGQSGGAGPTHRIPPSPATPGKTGATSGTTSGTMPGTAPRAVGTALGSTPASAWTGLRDRLPQYKPIASTRDLRGRLDVPRGVPPSYVVGKPPAAGAMAKLGPFVQRSWAGSVAWVAVPGLGYLTVPQQYYDRVLAFVEGDDPDFEGAAGLLSLAAVQEAESGRVRHSMPQGAVYRLTAPFVPSAAGTAAGNVPVFATTPGDFTHRGRIGVPDNAHPRITLLQPPRPDVREGLLAFAQRPWRRRFVWVAVAGLGYLTVPEETFARFLGTVSGSEPDYARAVGVLSAAAVQEDNEGRLRSPMPAGAGYRFQTAPLPPGALERGEACSFEPFVERKWNRPFVWVLIEQTGNVTVPEDGYDRFYVLISAEPPDYATACAELVAEAARDTIVAAHPLAPATDQAATTDACGLEPFIERRWNAPFVWVLIPQTGNVTVPEDYYDRFYALVSSDPPNFQRACRLLAAAAASDTVAVASAN